MADELDREAIAEGHAEQNRPVPDPDPPGSDPGSTDDETDVEERTADQPGVGDVFRSGS